MKKTIMIEGMMCKNCVKHVSEALKKLGLEAEVSLEEKKAILKNTDIDNQIIIDTIEELGFDVKEIING